MFGLTALFAIAGALTSLWLGVIGYYVSHGSGWANLLTLPPSDLAVFVLAALGPIAGLWLIAGYLLQGLQSRRLMIALRLMASQNRRSAEALEIQGAALREIVSGGGGDRGGNSTVAAVELAIRDLNGQMALLAERLGVFDQDEAETLWRHAQAGDLWGMAYAFLTRANLYPEFPHLLAERLATDPMAGDGLAGILRTGEGLIGQMADTGAPPLVVRIVEGGPIGRLLALFRHVDHLAGSYAGQVAPTGEAAPPFAPPLASTEDAPAAATTAPQAERAAGAPIGVVHAAARRETLGAQLGREGPPAEDTAAEIAAATRTVPEDITNALRRTVAAATESRSLPPAAAAAAETSPPAETKAEAEPPVLAEIIRGSHPVAPPTGAFEIIDFDLIGREDDDEALHSDLVAAPEPRPMPGDPIETSLNRLQEALRRMNEGDFASIADSDDTVGRHGDRVGSGIDPMPAPTMVLGATPARPPTLPETAFPETASLETASSGTAPSGTAPSGTSASRVPEAEPAVADPTAPEAEPSRPMTPPENPRYANKKAEPAAPATPVPHDTSPPRDTSPPHTDSPSQGARQPDFWTGTEWIVPPSSSP